MKDFISYILVSYILPFGNFGTIIN